MSDGPDDLVASAAQAVAAAPAEPAAATTLAPEATLNLKPSSIFDELAARRLASNGKGMVFGITADMLGDYLNRDAPATADELDAVTEETARDILYRRYWLPIAGDKLPEPVAAAIFDVAVRRGVDEAGKLLQRGLRRTEAVALKVDGRIGTQTLTAIKELEKSGKAIAIAERLMAERTTLAFRLGDGKFFGRDVDLGGVAWMVGKAIVQAKTGIKL